MAVKYLQMQEESCLEYAVNSPLIFKSYMLPAAVYVRTNTATISLSRPDKQLNQ
mgnify:CR=1 FL=1